MKKVGIGLYGVNGHQLSPEQIQQVGAELIGVCDFGDLTELPEVIRYESYELMLSDPHINLISLCAPKRSEQGELIIQAIQAGKHVYAEKPCVRREDQLDEILTLAEENGVIFCEMSGSMYEEPYQKAKELVESGILGEIVQVFVQKSYPYVDRRPQDEDIDGGLLEQCAIYGLRFIEQVAGQVIVSAEGIETTKGNPKQGNLRMAAAINAKLQSGAIGTVIANYLNQPSTKVWGNEELRIFGTKGFLQTNIKNKSVEVYIQEQFQTYQGESNGSLLQVLVSSIEQNKPLPFSPEWLLSPTRWAIRIKNAII